MLKRPDLGWTRPALPLAKSFLHQLTASDFARLQPHLEAITVSRGATLFDVADAGEHVYFPQGPLISVEQHNRVEVALIGSEGLVGWPALVGVRLSPYHAVVRGCDGTVLRMRTDVARTTMSFAPAIELALNRFVTVISVQMAETITAHASHRIDVRLVRWILLRHDRLGGDQILVHHDEIAENLGARRASITDCLHVLEGSGMVRCRRGRISVRDRAALETLAAGCYGAAESVYRDSIGTFGKQHIVREPAGPSDLRC